MQCWVLHWRYYDGSGFDIARVYIDQDRANEDFDLVRNAEDGKTYTLIETCIYGPTQ